MQRIGTIDVIHPIQSHSKPGIAKATNFLWRVAGLSDGQMQEFGSRNVDFRHSLRGFINAQARSSSQLRRLGHQRVEDAIHDSLSPYEDLEPVATVIGASLIKGLVSVNLESEELDNIYATTLDTLVSLSGTDESRPKGPRHSIKIARYQGQLSRNDLDGVSQAMGDFVCLGPLSVAGSQK